MPSTLEINGKIIFNPKWSHYESDGWKEFPENLKNIEIRFIKWVNADPVELSQEEKDILISQDFTSAKNSKLNQIDEKTNEVINDGFEFDGETFSLSLAAQQNWTGYK